MAKQTQTQSSKAGEFTFGVEIECFVPRKSRHRGGRLSPGKQPSGWISGRLEGRI